MEIKISPFNQQKSAKLWIEKMLMTMPHRTMVKGNCELDIIFNLKSDGNLDILLEPVIYCIVKKGWIEDIKYVQSLNVQKVKTKKESIEIEIYKE